MKGISAVIATILMLMITIALAGMAYTYIIGMWGGRTGVVLSIDAQGTKCVGDTIIVAVRNDGSSDATGVVVTSYDSTGTARGSTAAFTVAKNSINTANINRVATDPVGTHALSAVATGGSATGDVVCSTVGV